jgi:pimeloyl-ACP methyl ester carboxylesterase
MGMNPRVAIIAALAAGLSLPATASAASLSGVAVPEAGPASSGRPGRADAVHDTTSPQEARRTAAAALPELDWWSCAADAECTTAEVPLDYDDPKGPTTRIALARVKAKDPAHRIGTLFLNPGGPGGSGVEFALDAGSFLGEDILRRFDIVGFDPRGINFSDQVRCFKNTSEQDRGLEGFSVPFPVTPQEEESMISSARALGKACATTGEPLSASVSTAQVARDMEVLRRTLGDQELNFLGFSYGSELGLTYANMFPDRVRAIAVDGVIDPVQWAGTKQTSSKILDDRLGSADGAYKALKEILTRCDKTTTKICALAGRDPVGVYETVAQRLRKSPLVLSDSGEGGTYTYADFINSSLGSLYYPDGWFLVMDELVDLQELTDPNASPAERTAAARSFLAGKKAMVKNIEARFGEQVGAAPSDPFPGRDFPYSNSLEAASAVICTDGRHPSDVSLWPKGTAELDERAPYFGRAWGWSSVQCASNTWKAQDEDAYTGPFNRRTATPVLLVGNYWDPATAYTSARSVADGMQTSRLLSSDSWGHTAYGTSGCVTSAVERYLLDGTLPPEKLTCTGDRQPFDSDTAGDGEADLSSAAGESKVLPPIAADPNIVQAQEQALDLG